MESIRPGYGYWIKVNKNTNLCLSTANCATGTTTLRLANASHPDFDSYDVQTWVVNPSDYEYNMLIWGYVDIDGKTLPPSTNAQGAATDIKVAAYNGNQCRGVGELVYVPEMNRYLMSMFVYANAQNEVLDFRIHLPESQKYYQHFEGIHFEADGIVASSDNPYKFSNVEPTKAFHAEAYPNPFDRILKIDHRCRKRTGLYLHNLRFDGACNLPNKRNCKRHTSTLRAKNRQTRLDTWRIFATSQR